MWGFGVEDWRELRGFSEEAGAVIPFEGGDGTGFEYESCGHGYGLLASIEVN